MKGEGGEWKSSDGVAAAGRPLETYIMTGLDLCKFSRSGF